MGWERVNIEKVSNGSKVNFEKEKTERAVYLIVEREGEKRMRRGSAEDLIKERSDIKFTGVKKKGWVVINKIEPGDISLET